MKTIKETCIENGIDFADALAYVNYVKHQKIKTVLGSMLESLSVKDLKKIADELVNHQGANTGTRKTKSI